MLFRSKRVPVYKSLLTYQLSLLGVSQFSDNEKMYGSGIQVRRLSGHVTYCLYQASEPVQLGGRKSKVKLISEIVFFEVFSTVKKDN